MNITLCVFKHVGTHKHTQKHMRIHTQAQGHTQAKGHTCTYSNMHTHKHAHSQHQHHHFQLFFCLPVDRHTWVLPCYYCIWNSIFRFWNFALKIFGYKVKIRLYISIITLNSLRRCHIVLCNAHTSLHVCQQWACLCVLIHSCYLLVFLVVAIVMGVRSLDIAWIVFA